MSAEHFAELLHSPHVRHYFTMYVHSRSEAAERELLRYFEQASEEEISSEMCEFLSVVHSEYFVPMLETKLFAEVRPASNLLQPPPSIRALLLPPPPPFFSPTSLLFPPSLLAPPTAASHLPAPAVMSHQYTPALD